MTETRHLFGTDGVRGVANVYPMTAEVALQLGRALAYVIKYGPGRHRIVVGKDTRLSGYLLEYAITAGICSMGVDVLLLGPLPTPGIAFITSSMRADAGVVISASHNPYQDNGIKFFSGDGFKLPDEIEAHIENLMTDPDDGGRPTHRHRHRPGLPHRRRPGPLHLLPEEHLPQGTGTGRPQDRPRLRPRGHLPGGAGGLRRVGGGYSSPSGCGPTARISTGCAAPPILNP